MEDKKLRIKDLSEQEVQLILSALGKLPFEQVCAVIPKIQKQFIGQSTEKKERPEKEEEKKS